MQKETEDVNRSIDQERKKAVLAELGEVAHKYCIPVDAIERIIESHVPTLADYDVAHTAPLIRNLHQRGLDAKDAIRVIELVQSMQRIRASMDVKRGGS